MALMMTVQSTLVKKRTVKFSCLICESANIGYARQCYCDGCAWVAARIQMAAISKVGRAVRHGEIPKATALICVDCGDRAKVYDHRDYTKPLEVEAVCVGCNIRRGPALRYR